MSNRRLFLKTAVAVLPMAAGTAAYTKDRIRRAGALAAVHAVMVDERYEEGRRLGAQMAAAATTVYALSDGDMTQVWLRQVGPAWHSGAGPVAGLTARPALFCFEQLALGCGRRVMFHAEHVIQADGQTRHQVLRGGEWAGCTRRDLIRAGAHWPERIASCIARYRDPPERPRVGPSEAALAPVLPVGERLLTSWIIAAA